MPAALPHYQVPSQNNRISANKRGKLAKWIRIPLYRVDQLAFWRRHAKLDSIDLSKVDVTEHALHPTPRAARQWQPDLHAVNVKCDLDDNLAALYEDHTIKEEMDVVTGPTVLQICNNGLGGEHEKSRKLNNLGEKDKSSEHEKSNGHIKSEKHDMSKSGGHFKSEKHDMLKSGGHVKSEKHDMSKSGGHVKSEKHDMSKSDGHVKSEKHDMSKSGGHVKSEKHDMSKSGGHVKSEKHDMSKSGGHVKSEKHDMSKSDGHVKSEKHDMSKSGGHVKSAEKILLTEKHYVNVDKQNSVISNPDVAASEQTDCKYASGETVDIIQDLRAVNVKSEPDDNLAALYEDHTIKEELDVVIGPTILQISNNGLGEEEIDVVSLGSTRQQPLAATSAQDRQHINHSMTSADSSEEEIDVVSLDTTVQHTLALTSLVRTDTSPLTPSSQNRRHLRRTINTAITPRPAASTIASGSGTRRRRGPTRSRRHLATRGRDRRSNTDSESEAESPEIERRSIHNDMERLRRMSLKNLFDGLKEQIPATRSKERAPRVVILHEAIALCRKIREEEIEREHLKKQQTKLATRLKKLRRLCVRFRTY